MKKKSVWIVLLALLMLFSFTLAACDDNGGGSAIRHADADSIEILGTNTTYTPGEYTLEAAVKPAQADQGVRWSVSGEDTTGVSVGGADGNVLTVGSNATDGAVITLRATSTYDTAIYVTRSYTLDIPEIEGTPIYTEEELRSIDLNGSYILMNDIALTQPWEPIGSSEKEDDTGAIVTPAEPFNGVFDGNGYTISNIQYENTNVDPDAGPIGEVLGFFEQIGGSGEVKNLGLQGSIKAVRWCGGIAAINDGIISNCWSDIDVELTGAPAGGLVSVNRGRVEYSYCVGTITTNADNSSQRSAGLFVNAGSVVSCFGDREAMTTDNYQTILGAIKNTEVMRTTEEMKTASTFDGWDTEVWSITNGNYPQLINPDFEGGEEDPFVAITSGSNDVDINSVYDYQITVDVSGVEDTSVEFELAEPVDGVSIGKDTGLMTFDPETVEDYAQVTVVATLVASPETTSSVTFHLINNDFDTTNIFRVRTEQDLYRVATTSKYLSGDIILMNDIVLDEYANWPGIGNASAPFTGTFDGQGYTISGLARTAATGAYGFFGTINAASADTVAVKNLKLVGSIAGSPSWAGTMVGTFQRGIIENCFVDVDISTEAGLRIGGFVGVNSEEGAAHSTIRHCISVGKVSTGGGVATAGGFAAANNGTMQYCYVDATNSGADKLISFGGEVATCALYTDIEMRTASTFTDEMLGNTVWHKQDASWPTLINDDFVAPPTETYVYIDFDSVIDVYTTAEQQLQAKEFTAGDVSATFALQGDVTGVSVSEGGLITFTDDFVPGTSFTVTATYNGATAEKVIRTTSSAPVAIGTAEELYALTQAGADLSRDYYLTASIDLSDYSNWAGIGSDSNPFTGTFDGRGYTVSGFSSSGSGLFGTLNASANDVVILKNLRLEGSLAASSWTGGLANKFNRGIVENCIIDVDVSASGGACGLVFGVIVDGSEAGPNGSTVATFRNSIVLGTADSGSYVASGWMKTIGAVAGAVNGTISNVFYDSANATAAMTNGSLIDGCAKTAEELQTATTYSAFDSEIWNIAEGSYPTLKVQAGAAE